MINNDLETKEDIIKRLKRIEGQVRGIQKMVDEEQYCGDILTQVAAVRGAINKVGRIVLEKHSVMCIEKASSSEDAKKALSELAKVIQSFIS